MSDLAELFRSPEYAQALRERILSGKGVTTAELRIAREMGLIKPTEDRDSAAKLYLSQMDPQTLSVLNDLSRVSMTSASTTIRLVRAGSMIGVLMPATLDVGRLMADPSSYDPGVPDIPIPSAEPPREDDSDLMPRKATDVLPA